MSAKTRLLLTAWAGIVAALALAQGGSKSPEQIRDAVARELALRHPSATPEWWKGLGPQAPAVIVSMHEKSQDIYERVRLLEGLGNFDDPTAVEYLKKQAAPREGGAGSDSVVRNAAIKSVGRARGGQELEWLGGFLDHGDVQTRLAAAETVQKIALNGEDARSADARKALEEYLAREKAAWVGDRLRRNERRLAEGGPKTRQSLPLSTQSTGGARPAPVASPSAAPAAAVDTRFSGNWQGYVLSPEASAPGLASEPARMSVRVESDHSPPRLAFTLEVSPPKKARRTLRFASDQRHARVVAGELGAAGQLDGKDFEAVLNEASAGPSGIGRRTMILRVPATGMVAVLRKIP